MACVNQIKTIRNGDGDRDVTKQRVSKESNGCARALGIMVHVTALIDQILRCLQNVNNARKLFLTICNSNLMLGSLFSFEIAF